MYEIGFITALPVIWEFCAKFDALGKMPALDRVLFAYFFFQFPLVVCPLILRGAFFVSDLCVKLIPAPQTRLAMAGRQALLVIGILIEMTLIAFPAEWVSRNLRGVPRIVVFVIYIVVTLVVFRGRAWKEWCVSLLQPTLAAEVKKEHAAEEKEAPEIQTEVFQV